MVATALGMALQPAAMKLAFGQLFSVAATIKTHLAFQDLPGNVRLNVFGSAFQTLTFGLQLTMAGLAIALHRDRRTVILVLAAFSFLGMHTVLSVLRGWYWVPSFMGLLFALEQAEAGHPRLSRVRSAVVALATLAFVGHGIRAQLVYAGDQRAAASFLTQMRAKVPRASALYTYDNPGYLGFFSGFDVVDADGLVNDVAYAQRLRDGSLAGYLDEERICYIVTPDADATPVLDMAGLVLHQQEVVRLLVVRREVASQSDFALFRLAPPRCR